MAKLADLPQWAPSTSAITQLSGVLATSHLSMGFIQDLLSTFNEAKDLTGLLEFLSLVKEKTVPEAIVWSTLQETVPPANSRISSPEHWTHSLTCQLLCMHIAKIDPNAADSIAPTLYKKIQQNCSVAPAVEKFITDHIDLVVGHSAEFVSVLELLYKFQVKGPICAAVFQSLPMVSPLDWVDATDQLIIGKLYQESHLHSVEELMQKITQCMPNDLHDPLSVTSTTCHGNIPAYEKQVVEALKDCIINELEEVKSSCRDALKALKQKENLLKNEILSIKNETEELKQEHMELIKSHAKKVKNIEREEENIGKRLEEIKKEKEESLKKEKLKEAELKKELGKNAEEDKTVNPEATSDDKWIKSEVTLLIERLKELDNEKKDLEEKFIDSESTYDKKNGAISSERRRVN